MIDAFCAADAFLSAIDSGHEIDAGVLQSIQDARLPPIVAAQSGQDRRRMPPNISGHPLAPVAVRQEPPTTGTRIDRELPESR